MDPIKFRSLHSTQAQEVSQAKLPASKDAKQAAQQFEALLLQEMLKSMWATVPQGKLLSGSHEESMYRDMLNEAVADSISQGQGVGIKDVILKDLNELNKKK
jgi:peptidoglycan hydrolase FlgJ